MQFRAQRFQQRIIVLAVGAVPDPPDATMAVEVEVFDRMAQGLDLVSQDGMAKVRKGRAQTDNGGFVAAQDDLLSSTRKGRAALTVEPPAKVAVVAGATSGDHVAIIGENRKLLIFPLDEAPRMARGKGVRMQRYKDGGVADARVFALKEGLTWTDASGRLFTVGKTELAEWIGHRAEAGRLPPRGFPRNNRFGD